MKFSDHLNRAERMVKAWPKWKKEAAGLTDYLEDIVMLDLKRCKCGAFPVLKVGPDLALSGNKWRSWVECSCGNRSRDYASSEKQAIKDWNNRVALLPLRITG